MNLPMWKKLVVVSVGLGLLGASLQPVVSLAQKPGAKAEAAEGKKAKGRLPPYYGDIVTPAQRDKIYEIQGKFEAQIAGLAEQIKALQQARETEIEGLLTPEQKTLLDKTRDAARAKIQEKAAAKKTASKTATETTVTVTAEPATPAPTAKTTTKSTK
jgi:hypothetical protein